MIVLSNLTAGPLIQFIRHFSALRKSVKNPSRGARSLAPNLIRMCYHAAAARRVQQLGGLFLVSADPVGQDLRDEMVAPDTLMRQPQAQTKRG